MLFLLTHPMFMNSRDIPDWLAIISGVVLVIFVGWCRRPDDKEHSDVTYIPAKSEIPAPPPPKTNNDLN